MISGQALKDRLQTIAKENGIPFNACWKQLLLERFLARLGQSDYIDKLIFKGGFLLAYMMKIGRETADLDFLLNRAKGEKKSFKKSAKKLRLSLAMMASHFPLPRLSYFRSRI